MDIFKYLKNVFSEENYFNFNFNFENDVTIGHFERYSF